jgi:hypothetical protein
MFCSHQDQTRVSVDPILIDRVPDTEMRDHRQLLMHRHKLVQIRTRVKNELQHLMLNQGMQKKQKLWSTEGRAALRRCAWTSEATARPLVFPPTIE